MWAQLNQRLIDLPNLTGWKRKLLLILLGVLVAGALPPFHIWPLAFVGFSGLILCLFPLTQKRALWFTGWWFGMGFFGAGLYWLTNAFLVSPDKHGWLIPLAVPALAAVMGLYIAATALLAHFLRPKKTHPIWIFTVIFALSWTVMEWMRSWLFTGFAWNFLATIWANNDAMIQPVAWVGPYGLGFLSLIAFGGVAAMVQATGKGRFVHGAVAILTPLGFWTAGSLRLPELPVPTHQDVTLRLVQPNIAQKTKWAPDHKIKNFNRHLELSVAPPEKSDTRPTHIIWPETAVTYALNRERGVQLAIGSVTPKDGLILTGTPRMTPRGQKPFQVWNSLMAIDDLGRIGPVFDKAHLVPFGEYLPFRAYVPFPNLTGSMVDFTAGDAVHTLNFKGLPPVSPLICYEIIFPGAVVDPENRPDWILNITNDGWYGNSPGPYQHLASARLRAIEEGLPLVRVANTGISVVTDPYGRTTGQIPYGIEGFLDSPLPQKLRDIPLYAQYGNVLWITILALSFAIITFFYRFKT